MWLYREHAPARAHALCAVQRVNPHVGAHIKKHITGLQGPVEPRHRTFFLDEERAGAAQRLRVRAVETYVTRRGGQHHLDRKRARQPTARLCKQSQQTRRFLPAGRMQTDHRASILMVSVLRRPESGGPSMGATACQELKVFTNINA